MKAIINATIYDFEHYYEDSYILFEDTVLEVGGMASYESAVRNLDKKLTEVTDAYGCLIMPGLINGHGHVYSTFARGISVAFSPRNFEELLQQLWWRLDKVLDKEAVYYSGIVHGVDSVKNGITTIVDHHASGMAIIDTLEALRKSLCENVGMRGVLCFETSDRFDVKACLDENIHYALNNKTDMSTGLFGLHASMSLSDETLQMVQREVSKHKVPIHIHVAESGLDNDWCLKDYGETVIQRLDRFGLLTEQALLAHCIHINEKDAKIIADRGCHVVINVSSNMNNGVGIPDLSLFKRFQIPVMIGNDGLSSGITGEWLAMNYATHHKQGNILASGLDDVIESINEGYRYASSRLSCQLGRIEKDYKADMIMVPYIPPTPMDSNNVFAHVYYGLAHCFKPHSVWCNGETLVTEYKVCKALDYKYKEAMNVAQNVWERMS